MRRKFYTALFGILIAVSVSVSPALATPAHAYDLNDAIDQVPKLLSKISVPSFDLVGFLKTMLNVAATTYAKQVISDMVNDTVRWANTGFEGNPAYVQNPGKYFLTTANNTAGSFIDQIGKGKLGFLCSPFQKQIQLSLIEYYYQPANQTFQCTWTGVTGNMQGFLSDFSQGGWDGWFSMTQQPTNNVYGAGVSAQLELSKQVEQTLGLKQQDYQTNKGFLNLPGDCLANNPSKDILSLIADDTWDGSYDLVTEATSIDQIANDKKNNIVPVNLQMSAGDCIKHGPTKTPGSMIQSGLEKTLGTGVDQLVNAQEFDQIASALMHGLLTRYVTGKPNQNNQGLFGPNYKDGLPSSSDPDNGHEIDPSALNPDNGGGTPTNSTLTCSVTPASVGINQAVVWSTNIPTSITGGITYKWTGDLLSGSDRTETLSYTAPGTYKGSVAVTIGGTTQTANCGSVTVTQNAPLSATCYASPIAVEPGETVTWTAYAHDGSGTIASASWEDTSSSFSGDTSGESFSDSVIGSEDDVPTATANITYKATGTRSAAVLIRDADPKYGTVMAQCNTNVSVGGRAL